MDKHFPIIYLVGFMGCGKTTLGHAVAERYRADFVDLDDYIEQSAGMTIKEIFAQRGEAAFRTMEREALARLSSGAMSAPLIVGCGGGTPCHGDNMEMMNSRGLTVWLDTSNERLFERLAIARGHRPLIAGLSDDELRLFIEHHVTRRTPYYVKAASVFDSTLLEDEEQVEATARKFIETYFNPSCAV